MEIGVNIFYLHSDPFVAAQMHCNKHVVKMIIETAQLLSTAHRINDGVEQNELTENGRRIKRFRLTDERDNVLYKSTHPNHPSAKWCRESESNYKWLYTLFLALLQEYRVRYNKDHACMKLVRPLRKVPERINIKPFTDPPPAMPDYCKVKGDSVQSYRNYYINEKKHFAKWTNREIPEWFKEKQK